MASWYKVEYSNEAVWADKNGHNGSESSGFRIIFNILADGLKEAIAKSEKALTAVTRDNNGKGYPFVMHDWNLKVAEQKRDQ